MKYFIIVLLGMLAVASAVAFTLGIVYLVWVLLSWGLISVVAAFGGVVGLTAWELAIPLWLTTSVLGFIFKKRT